MMPVSLFEFDNVYVALLFATNNLVLEGAPHTNIPCHIGCYHTAVGCATA